MQSPTVEKSPKEDLYCRTVSLHEASTSRSPWRPAIALKIGSGEPRQSFDTRSAEATSRVGSQAIMSCGGRRDGIACRIAAPRVSVITGPIRAGSGAAQKLTSGLAHGAGVRIARTRGASHDRLPNAASLLQLVNGAQRKRPKLASCELAM